MSLLYSLLAACLWGAGQIFIKIGVEDISPVYTNILSAFVMLVITIPFALLTGVHFNLVLSTYLFALMVATLSISYYYVIRLGQISLTGTIIATYPIITVLLSFLFLHENPSTFQKFSIILTIAGTIIIALPEKMNSLRKIKLGNWFWWGLFGSGDYGVSFFLNKVIIDKSDT